VLPTLTGTDVTLRPATLDDVPRFGEIARTPEVWRRWGDVPASEFTADIEGDELEVFAIELGDRVVGMIQYSEEIDPRYRHASIDIFLAPQYQHRGLGPDAVRTLAAHLFESGHHRITIDPAADNAAAIAAYARVGFRPVGVMRRYERIPEDQWHDNLLMDLLTEELT
jgi:aminoglycoside 6'-N-acetyltransferase